MSSRGLLSIVSALLLAGACGQATVPTGAAPTTTLAVAAAPVTEPPPSSVPPVSAEPEVEPETDTIDGLEVLYIGHSFGRPFAQNLGTAAHLAGVDGRRAPDHQAEAAGGDGGARDAPGLLRALLLWIQHGQVHRPAFASRSQHLEHPT